MPRLFLRPKAIEDLDDIWAYTVETWGVEQAEYYLWSLNKAFEKVADNPKTGKACFKIREGYFRLLVGRHYVFYRCFEDGIEVVRVLHETMEFRNHF